jgi:hypothetical protein
VTVTLSGTFGPDTYSAITPTYYADISSYGGFTTYTFTGTCHDSSGGLMQLGFICCDASGAQLNLGVPGTGGLADGQTATVTCGPSGSAFSGNFSTANHFRPYVSGYGDGFQTGSFDWTLTWDGTAPPPCQYGTSKNEPTASIVEVTPPLIEALGLAIGAEWAIPTILAGSAAHIALETLCSGPPMDPQTIVAADWTTTDATTHTSVAVRKTLQNFQNTVWHQFCH